jgi:hypothetical protein
MRISGAKTARVGESSFRAITWIVLLAFTLQSHSMQTHIHGALGDRLALAATLTNAPAHKNAPAENGTADCPFCQAIVHAAAFYAPSAPSLVLPISRAKAAVPFFTVETIGRFSSHLWHSRAPPRH